MTLSYGAFYTIVVICSIAIVALLFFLLYKWLNKQSEQVVSLVGSLVLGVGVLTFYLLKDCNTPIVEVRGFEKEEYVLTFGSTFTTSDNQEITIDDEADGCVVVNITDQKLYVEKLDYGIGFDFDGAEPIEEVRPHSYTILRKEPDFYPWDGAPEEISVTEGTFIATRTWVHF